MKRLRVFSSIHRHFTRTTWRVARRLVGPQSRTTMKRALSAVLIAAQIAPAVPVRAAAEASSDVFARLGTVLPAAALPLDSPPLAPPHVTVNRAVPAVTRPSLVPQFSSPPTDVELHRVRVFVQPLTPVGRATTIAENRALAEAIRGYVQEVPTGQPNDMQRFEAFLRRFPDSPWRPSLLLNLGEVYRRSGLVSRALETWDEAWQLTRAATDANGRSVAAAAVADWCELGARLGHVDAVEQRLLEIRDRDLGGAAGVKVSNAAMQITVLRQHPEYARSSGAEAIEALLVAGGTGQTALPKTLVEYHPAGLRESARVVQRLARGVGLALHIVKRTSRAAMLPVPAIAHLRSGRFVTVLPGTDGHYRLHDPGFGGDRDITRTMLEEESSGVFLTTADLSRTGGLAPVSDSEAAMMQTFSCPPGNPDADDGCDPSKMCCLGVGGAAGGGGGGNGGSGGSGGDGSSGGCASCDSPAMPTYNFHPLGALRLTDTPVGYAPPRGPAVNFTLRYNHRVALDDAFTSNVGSMWTFDWSSYVLDTPVTTNDPPYQVTTVKIPGGHENYGLMDYSPYNWRTRAQLVRASTDPVRLERHQPDGSVEVYDVPTAPTGTLSRAVLRSQLIDPRGQSLHFTYDAQFRLVAVTDALGQVTTLSYELPSDPLKITKVTDPFGRFATLMYDSAGRLSSITDVIGLTSSFVYGTNDFIDALVTPYGRTTFRHETNINGITVDRWAIEATDPLGATERLEWLWSVPSLPATAPASEVPTGFDDLNTGLNEFVSLYWDKRVMSIAPGDPTKATQTRWNWSSLYNYGYPFTVSVPSSIKRPLEGRVWYRYPADVVGSATPIAVGRVLDDGASQINQTTYNDLGHIRTRTDPFGRRTSYTYAANSIDVVDVRQTTGTLNDLLGTYADYTTQHAPQTVTDAAGQITIFTYDVNGEVLTETNAKNETTTFAYDTAGYLQSVTRAVGATMSYTYDGYGRVRTVSDVDGFMLTIDYDALDRRTRVTYPDGTFEQTTYDRLDPVEWRDRLGRVTKTLYDPLRRVISVRDPQGRTTSQQWCTCGSLEAVVDGKGQKTTWERDLQGRITREVRADDPTSTVTYEAMSGRLQTLTDPKLQVTTFTYNADDSLHSLAYTNALIATPSVSYTYDPGYARTATMTDGTGTTTYAYKPVGSLGATQLASVDGPLTNDTITYDYDVIGRVTSRLVNGIGTTVTYDVLGRVATESNVLGMFTYGYDGSTDRLASITYPNGQTSAYAYYGDDGDRRVQTIHHQLPGGQTLSKFDYAYDAAGRILTWRQQSDTDAVVEWRYTYDLVDQLVGAVKWNTNATPTVLQRQAFRFDPAGNRVTAQLDDASQLSTYDRKNRLLAQQAGGGIQVVGSVSEPANVTVQGKPAAVSSDNRFVGMATTSSGTNTFSVVATDASGNSRTQQYSIDQNGPSRTFAYDANGNLTNDGQRSFEWDARNELTAVTVGTHRTEFSYDGRQRRVREIQKENGVTQADTILVWCDNEICEERAADGATVTRRSFSLGEQVAGLARFFLRDHLGSVVAITDNSAGTLARYGYDPWGSRELLAGSDLTTAGYAGHRWLASANLSLTLYRAYDPQLARWISEDPRGISDGLNLYAYVANSPVDFLDQLGLQHSPGGPWHPEPPYDQVGCKPRDTCAELERKISTLSDMIRAHRNWDKKRNTDRHAQDIQELTNAIMNCQVMYEWKCKPCGDNKTCKKIITIIEAAAVLICIRVPVPVPVF